MKKVVFVPGQYSIAGFMNAMIMFQQAGVLWNMIMGKAPAPCFDVRLITPHGRPMQSLNGMEISAHGSFADAQDADLIIATSPADTDERIAAEQETITWLKQRYAEGAHVASICSGAFILAEAGILDNKMATTHWAQVQNFRARYPQVNLIPELLITDEGDVFCSGGVSSGIDLSLYLIEKYSGHQVALELKKAMVYDAGRTSQLPYTAHQQQKDHQDPKVLAVQEWLETHYNQNISYTELADQHAMSRRTLERRFKAATGHSPLTYLQHIRIEKAKELLESGIRSFDEITYAVGYADTSSFRKIFFRAVGLLPTEYRKKFQAMRARYAESSSEAMLLDTPS